MVSNGSGDLTPQNEQTTRNDTAGDEAADVCISSVKDKPSDQSSMENVVRIFPVVSSLYVLSAAYYPIHHTNGTYIGHINAIQHSKNKNSRKLEYQN